ncbi:MAG TPA: ATP-binding protein [Bacilli bacterium]|nr:ATP-binding protein [Bacilli bacterium]
MNELSLYILDIVQNSIKANSKNIVINIEENLKEDFLTIEIIDDGKGMSEETLRKVTDPFFTSRSTRRVGLGIPLFKELCETCLGNFKIESQVGEGTRLTGTLKHSNIDRHPMGNIVDTIYTLIINDDEVEIVYNHKFNNKIFTFNTKEIKQILDGVPFKQIDVMMWIKDYIKEGLQIIQEEEL